MPQVMDYFERGRLIVHSRLSLAQKMVLTIISQFAGADGTCFPSNTTLAKLSSLSDRGLRNQLAGLRKLGVLRTIRRKERSGRQTTNKILVVWESLRDLQPPPEPPPDDDLPLFDPPSGPTKGPQDIGGGGTSCQGEVARGARGRWHEVPGEVARGATSGGHDVPPHYIELSTRTTHTEAPEPNEPASDRSVVCVVDPSNEDSDPPQKAAAELVATFHRRRGFNPPPLASQREIALANQWIDRLGGHRAAELLADVDKLAREKFPRGLRFATTELFWPQVVAKAEKAAASIEAAEQRRQSAVMAAAAADAAAITAKQQLEEFRALPEADRSKWIELIPQRTRQLMGDRRNLLEDVAVALWVKSLHDPDP